MTGDAEPGPRRPEPTTPIVRRGEDGGVAERQALSHEESLPAQLDRDPLEFKSLKPLETTRDREVAKQSAGSGKDAGSP